MSNHVSTVVHSQAFVLRPVTRLSACSHSWSTNNSGPRWRRIQVTCNFVSTLKVVNVHPSCADACEQCIQFREISPVYWNLRHSWRWTSHLSLRWQSTWVTMLTAIILDIGHSYFCTNSLSQSMPIWYSVLWLEETLYYLSYSVSFSYNMERWWTRQSRDNPIW